jgi:hypothetical protein
MALQLAKLPRLICLSGKKRASNYIAVGVTPSEHRIYVPALAFENYMIASKERAIFARSPFIASWALQSRKYPTPDFTNALAPESCLQGAPKLSRGRSSLQFRPRHFGPLRAHPNFST